MIKKSVWIMALLGCTAQAWAQPRVDVNAIKQKFPEARAVVLVEEEQLIFKVKNDKLDIKNSVFSQQLHLDEQMASYNERAIPYIPDFFELTQLEACTYVPRGNSLRKEKVNSFQENQRASSSIFYDDMKYKSFVYPGIQPGAISELKYTYNYLKPEFLGAYYFKSGIPGLKASYKVTVPNQVKIKYRFFGDTTGIVFSKVTKGGESIYTWEIGEHQELKPDDDAPDMRYYEPHVFVYVEEYETRNGPVRILGNEQDLYKFNYGFIKDVNTGDADTALTHVVDSLRKVSADDDQLIKNIYYWVQDHIKYIAFEDGLGGYIPRQANDVYHKKYGDCKDMASIISFMLKQARIKSYLCWIGTRDLPYSYHDIPLPSVDNHMIAAVHRNGKWIFLDGTAPHLRYGMPSGFIQGKETMIAISSDSFDIVQVPVPEARNNYATDSLSLRIDGNALTGNAVYKVEGYGKSYMEDRIADSGVDKLEEELKNSMRKGSNKCEITNIKHQDIFNRDKPSVINYDIKIDDYVRKIDKDIFVNLNLSKSYQNEKIDTALHTYDKEFRYRYINEDICVLQIPQGYTLKKLPGGISLNNGKYAFDIKYIASANKIILKRSFRFNDLMLYRNEFNEWNKALDKLIASYKELVVLTKTN